MTKITSKTGTIVEHGKDESKWLCSNCGGVNPPNKVRCMGCNTDKPQSTASQTSPEGFNPDSTENLDKAHDVLEGIDLGNFTAQDGGRDKVLQAASYLRLAVEKKEGTPGDAAERLSFVLLILGELEKARHFANLAISQDKNSVFARVVLFFMAMGDFDTAQVHIPEPDFSGGAELFGSLLIGGTIAAMTGANKSSKKRKMLDSAQDIGRSFNALMEEKPPWKPGYFIQAGEQVFAVAGILQDNYQIKEEYLLQSVVEAPWGELGIPEDMQEEVEDLQARAHGMLLL